MVRNDMVDNNTYNVLQAFVSTLEALEAYQKYSQDGNQQLWQQVSQHTEQVARILQQQLPQVLQHVQGSQGAMRTQGTMGSQGMMGSQRTVDNQGAMASQNQPGMGQSTTYDSSGNFGSGQRQPDR
jgi:hypothetical protein